MSNIITILVSVLGSSVVAGFVSHFYQSTRYLKDKRFQAYIDYLEQYSKIFSPEVVVGVVDRKKGRKIIEHLKVTIPALEKHLWKIQLVSGKDSIKEKAREIFRTYDQYLYVLDAQKSTTKSFDVLNAHCNKVRDEMIKEMNEEMGKHIF